ncbi:hypothetical protein DID88_002443 [Monilinia fructigena]|uniref:Cystathionine gamma-synthase n=1 Tax=Monilinia fructigena TaxID=38457 RepID=A0A395IPY3_9HELO|nr:hypothetical protein DID88_002443 [Monilinia fructigena]
MSNIELGESVPALTPHATSVSLPTWKDNIGYEEGDQRVVGKMTTGYPRFFIHKLIAAFADDIVKAYGCRNEQAMLFPSAKTARNCVAFMLSREKSISPSSLNVVDLIFDRNPGSSEVLTKISPSISAVLYPKELFPVAKQYWQHSGDGVSSRRAEFCHTLFQEGLLVKKTSPPSSQNGDKLCKGPKRYQKGSIDKSSRSHNGSGSGDGHQSWIMPINSEARESSQFLEERFGRNLDVSFVDNAKSAIRRRITGSLIGEVDLAETPKTDTTSNMRGVPELSEEDILQKFGPGCKFYGNGSSEDLDDLENRLKAGEKYLALFCEFPGNPMLNCPDLKRIRALADKYDFAVVVDETIGNFINVHVLPFADIVVSSLTKIFSGECNVMGGSAIFNTSGKYYQALKSVARTEYEDNYWAEDVMFMERNSRNFVPRIEKINDNAEVICDILRSHPLVKSVYYPKYNTSRNFYDDCRAPNGGYGGLLSFTFKELSQAVAFYDKIETAKGPSLGTNFTLTSPYVILAHYMELDWAAQFGVPAELIRISVGLEDANDLKARFAIALKAAEDAGS